MPGQPLSPVAVIIKCSRSVSLLLLYPLPGRQPLNSVALIHKEQSVRVVVVIPFVRSTTESCRCNYKKQSLYVVMVPVPRSTTTTCRCNYNNKKKSFRVVVHLLPGQPLNTVGCPCCWYTALCRLGLFDRTSNQPCQDEQMMMS